MKPRKLKTRGRGRWREVLIPENTFDLQMPLFEIDCEPAFPPTNTCGELITTYKVTDESPQYLKDAMEAIARYAKREMGWDGTMYFCKKGWRPEAFGYLLCAYEYNDGWRAAIGVVGFAEERHYTNQLEPMTLEWVWLHPFIRRKGVLAAIWPRLRREHGDFLVYSPNKDMRRFLRGREEYSCCGRKKCCDACLEEII